MAEVDKLGLPGESEVRADGMAATTTSVISHPALHINTTSSPATLTSGSLSTIPPSSPTTDSVAAGSLVPGTVASGTNAASNSGSADCLRVPTTLNVPSAGTAPKPTKPKAKSKSKKKENAGASGIPLTSTAPPTNMISTNAEQSPTVADSELGDNPNKVLQAVRSTTLPFPLPVPTYSQAVQAARASGNVLTERATIIRETVKFFLNHKYWWTSEDYDRIAELVVNEFPELRDPVVWPTTPCYSKVRLDLSMCARNIRRIAKNQEKRRGSSPRHNSIETTDTVVEPPPPPPQPAKQRKGSGKGSKKSNSNPSVLSSPTMVTLPAAGQMLPHTAHTAVPTTSVAHDKKEVSLPYMLTSTAPASSSSSSTVLPPVAHFLGHPSAHSHSPGGIVFPSLLPATYSLTTSDSSSHSSTPPIQVTAGSSGGAQPASEGSGAASTTDLGGSRHSGYMDSAASLAAAWRPDAQLPEPLPVPPYSDKVMKARKMGVTKYERPLVIRETVLFFLSLKYWWSSVDYDRISDFVVDYFPDLKDPMLSPNMPPNRRVRTDLSQTARNIRRREVMLRRRDSRSPEDRFSVVGSVSVHPHGAQPPHTSDFCNELLAAASIIESREDVAKALELHAGGASREMDGKTGVITHTQTMKMTADASKTQPSSSASSSSAADAATLSKEHVSEGAKFPYNYAAVGEAAEENLEPCEGAVLNSQVAVIKQEVGEDESQLDHYQALQAQNQASQAWLSAQMTQALSMQALSGLSTQMSQALSSVAQISEQLMSPTRSSATLPSTPPVAHRSGISTGGVSGGGGGGGAGGSSSSSSNGVGSTPSHSQPAVSVPQLSQVGCTLPTATTTPMSDNSLGDSSHVDRMSAMAMWRSTCLPDPLPVPPFTLNVLRARDSGNTASARPRIIRETTQFFLAMKMWWTTQDYERIAELVLHEFPALKTVQNIKKDLGTCARNMRRRLPLSRTKQFTGYQSPPHGTQKDGDGIRESAGLTLGELANMASLREAQDKSKAETSGLAALTEEQRKTLLAHTVYEQNSLAWNALYQCTSETSSVPSQSRSNKRSLSGDTSSSSKGIEAAERELAEALKQTALQQAGKQFEEAEAKLRHSTDVNEGGGSGVKIRDLKKELDSKGHRADAVTSEASKSDSHPVMKELISSHPVLAPREQKKLPLDTSATAFHAAQSPLMTAIAESFVHAHQTPLRAHSQPSSQMRSEVSSAMEEEVPMNLTCSSEITKQRKTTKQVKSENIKSEPKASKNNSSVEAFNAREQVWFPHGSPWKKSGQNVFKSLPTPLPFPKYSQKLIKAHEEGLAYRHRSEIIRETARFFLGFKYWWSSADYSRISELVVMEFPELKDPVTHPGQPCYRRVQRDLSMCARNLRRKNTRRQHLTLGDLGTVVKSPKKIKNTGPKEKKIKKEGGPDIKKEAVLGNTNGSAESQQHLQLSQVLEAVSSTAYTPNTASSLAQAIFQTPNSDHTPLPSLSASLLAAGLSSKALSDGSKLSSLMMDSVHTPVVGSAIAPHFPPSVSAAVPPAASAGGVITSSAAITPASVPVSMPQLSSILGKDHLPRLDKKSKDPAPKKVSSIAHGSYKPVSGSKSVKSVAPSTHRQQQDGTGKQSSSGMSPRKVGSAKGSSRHNQLSSRSCHADARALSNTTAIVTPTLSEAHSTESRSAEGGVSDKVYINPEHGSELQIQLTKLWQEGKFFDASLEVDDYRLPVHKLVLLAASPYLQSTFRHANPTSHLEVNLPRDTGVGAARDFLKYIYEGVLHVAPETVNALRRIAAMLQIDQLLTYCDDYICRLTNTPPANTSLHNTLQHNTPQVPRVSVNLRDPAHSHQLSTDQNSLGVTGQSLDYADGHSAVSVGNLQYVPGETNSSRKRSALSSVAGQTQYQAPYGMETVEDRDKTQVVQTLAAQHEQQEEPGLVLAKRMRTSRDLSDQAVTTMVLDPQAGLSYHDVVGEQQLRVVTDHLDSLQQSSLVQQLPAEKLPGHAHHSSSVIQCGPNVMNAPAQHVLSQPSSTAEPHREQHEAAIHYIPETGGGRQVVMSDVLTSAMQQPPPLQLAAEDENVMVTILPHTGVEVEVGEEMMVDSAAVAAHTLQHLSSSGEDGQVVEEVVVDTGDLLQDVEVAACETVECSLLPQTYCSSPEDSQQQNTLSSDTDSALQSMASRWAAQQYAETPLDAATAQQFAAALQERMYGTHSGSPSTIQQDHQQDVGYEQQPVGEVYMQQCSDGNTVYLTTQPQAAGQELVVETSSPGEQAAGDGQASLLPQTYCSSPHSHSPIQH